MSDIARGPGDSLSFRFTRKGNALYLKGVLVKKTIESQEIKEAIDRMAKAIADAHPKPDNLVLAGIANGGIPLCSLLENALSRRFGTSVPKAVIDISFHRDDIGHHPITKEVQATHMATDPEDSTIILVDDVFFSGRTVRAAIAEVLTIGRPYQVELAVLVDRGNRRLPFAANYTGLVVPTTPAEKVEVNLDLDAFENSKIEILDA
ncbi:bifunctional pyr operon transcriptional regulator/uracil phosphoribosyltransferase PyrR [Pelagicoccus sp. SDUM812003]|uniref:bifunctional pyr operon transcriptional regulator/uracil phosphoribosyltransferase PyrR n=1 Tax=Pelagicoccus sp. SDUM812003 TaxID=3041267 RepID=UPI00280D66BD|nr:bifunctional pyr operon transcriptional regulator/uracil phosphoribosyltransferase PyrR [Pelagicoccus sp. SDUM812003]MDQ8201849.1 bifunctional pyr operon transcriptional regulator/uracil phosphoribosyltransferase PyrR [Pelagicoccus sp. SDUM812003]